MRILVTGATGFIGSFITQRLKAEGHEVWNLSKGFATEENALAVDLLDAESTEKALSSAPDFDAVIHLAAIAHGEKPPEGYDTTSANVSMTRNLLSGLRKDIHFILFSSVAVYSQCGQKGAVSPLAETNPPTAYGKSKAASEELVIRQGFRKVDILRLPPVYDEDHWADVRKRVFFPVSKQVRFRLRPSPKYSLCHISKIGSVVAGLVEDKEDKTRVFHVADDTCYLQNQLCGWFSGPVLPVPVVLLKPFLAVLSLAPSEGCRKISYNIKKLFFNNVYDTETVKQIK
ncbi:MAG: NAD(P)-dependent oxidoreductase [Desulfobacteraceae bacterium]|nr:NAD(P)-dependent oxidoreductase [Desulfobacteraceae bacterium]